MGDPEQVKKTAKAEVVVDKTVPHVFRAYHGLKRHLDYGKQPFEFPNQLVASKLPHAWYAAEDVAERQKLFLHQSVSRFKPQKEVLEKWVVSLKQAPVLHVNDCHITLIQPHTKRPGRTFFNPEKAKKPGQTYNDGLSYSAIVLLEQNRLPATEADEASHLCGHGRCVNPAHLVWERSSVNFSRNECHHYNMPCSHSPPCIPNTAWQIAHIKKHLAYAKSKSTRKRKKKIGLKYMLTKYRFTKTELLPPARSMSHKSSRQSSLVRT